MEAERVYIYMRDEYPTVLKILADEITAIEEAGIVEPGYVELRRGAGAYICGEESAMIESIEGKRGLPRHRPPFVAQGWRVWPAHPGAQCGDGLLDAPNPGERRRLVRLPRQRRATRARGPIRFPAG